jgi:hypothetical protein
MYKLSALEIATTIEFKGKLLENEVGGTNNKLIYVKS